MKKTLIIFLFVLMPVVQSIAGSTQKIHLFYTNDLQGGIGRQKATFMNPNFPPVLGGGAASAAIINKYRAMTGESDDFVLLLDGGDILGGTPAVATKSKGLAVIDYMNTIGYDAMVPGINDFDYGTDNLLKLAESADFPMLAANIYEKETSAQPLPIKPYTIIEKQGLKIGLFGIISKSAEQHENVLDKKDWVFKSEVLAARKAVSALKKEGADLIIGLAHLGLPYDAQEGFDVIREQVAQNIRIDSYINTMELARYVEGIDVIISGQIHRGYDEPWEDPIHHTLCFQNYANGGNLGLVTLKINSDTKTISGYEFPLAEGSLMLLSEDEFWPDNKMAEKIAELEKRYAPEFDKVIGVSERTLTRSTRGESPMANLMCDAMIKASGADFAFNNFVSIRRDLPIGPITARDVSTVFPFGNEIIVVTMEGSLLRELIEGSVAGTFGGMAIGGGQVVYNSSQPDGQKIEQITVNGQSLFEDQLYKVATTEYLAAGNYGMTKLAFLEDDRFAPSGVIMMDAVVDYIKENTPLKIKTDGRWQRK